MLQTTNRSLACRYGRTGAHRRSPWLSSSSAATRSRSRASPSRAARRSSASRSSAARRAAPPRSPAPRSFALSVDGKGLSDAMGFHARFEHGMVSRPPDRQACTVRRPRAPYAPLYRAHMLV